MGAVWAVVIWGRRAESAGARSSEGKYCWRLCRCQLALLCAAAAKDCRQCRNQYVHVEPERPIADVEAILGALNAEIAVATRGNLPEARDAGRYGCTQRPEFRVECVQMIGGKKTWTNEAHVP